MPSIFFFFFFFFNDTATTEIYTRPYTLSLHDALPIRRRAGVRPRVSPDDVRTTLTVDRSEEHTSELQSHGLSSYAVFCLKKKKKESGSCRASLVRERKRDGCERR